jgi:hypothetical protein
MFCSASISKLLKYHSEYPNPDKEVIKSIVDSLAWEHVDSNIDPSFSLDQRNLRFGLALDGVNPFKHNSTQYSTWPVLMLIYNLPPVLVTKKFFIQLSILISSKDAPTNNNIDVVLRPLIEELQLLWKGIPAQDFSEPAGHRAFKLRGILMWTLLDYPGYRLISGVCIHGFKGCTVCGPQTDSRSAKSDNKLNAERQVRGSKIIFGGSKRWTRRNHPYRRSLNFDGKEDFRPTPVWITAQEILRCAEERQTYLSSRGREKIKYDPMHEHGVKRKNILYKLEYWKVTLFPYPLHFHFVFALFCSSTGSPLPSEHVLPV